MLKKKWTTPEEARAILESYLSGMRVRAVAEGHGVSRELICKLVKGRTRRLAHLAPTPAQLAKRASIIRRTSRDARVIPAIVKYAVSDYMSGMTYREVGSKFGVSGAAVFGWVNGWTRAHADRAPSAAAVEARKARARRKRRVRDAKGRLR